MPDGFQGWEGRITGVDRMRDDGLHVFVAFEVRPWGCWTWSDLINGLLLQLEGCISRMQQRLGAGCG